jgi:hypothetical protein
MSRERVCEVRTEPKEAPSFGHLSRRTFLSRLGAAGTAVAAASPLPTIRSSPRRGFPGPRRNCARLPVKIVDLLALGGAA